MRTCLCIAVPGMDIQLDAPLVIGILPMLVSCRAPDARTKWTREEDQPSMHGDHIL